MFLLFCILLGICSAYFSGSSIFLTVTGLILSTTLIASAFDFFSTTGLVVIFTALSLCLFFYKKHTQSVRDPEWLSTIIFLFFFVITFTFTFFSSDFVPEGERLRDFSLLSSTIQSPYTPLEPWMSGSGLNYYIFWYRVGAFFSNLGNLSTPVVYPVLLAFCVSLFGTSIFILCRRFFNFTLVGGFFASIFVVFGSNIDGLLFFISKPVNATWWGPSRVVKGAINEFPAWSLLLGDLHPHVMNLSAIPLSLIFTDMLVKKKEYISAVLFAFFVMPAFLFGSNAWETPFYVLFICVLLVTSLYGASFQTLKENIILYFKNLKRTEELLRICFFCLLFISAMIGCSHIVSLGDSFFFVRDPIARTTSFEALLHFGVPLFLIALGNLFLFTKLSHKIFFFGCCFFALLNQEALSFIFLLLFSTFLHADKRSAQSNAFAVTGILLFLFPEILFLNDNYGGENERMNTIFKVYCIAWPVLHIAGFNFLKEVVENFKISRSFSYGVQIAALSCSLLFFIEIFPERIRVAPTFNDRLLGLLTVEKEYPGLKDLILHLKNSEKGVVLEAQGNPYSRTSFISTLSEQRSYLGWINHLDLLLKNIGETRRRNDVTKKIYDNSTQCVEKQSILSKENIKYVVVGPLEKVAFPNIDSEQFSCLEKLIETQAGVVFVNK